MVLMIGGGIILLIYFILELNILSTLPGIENAITRRLLKTLQSAALLKNGNWHFKRQQQFKQQI
jgi:hypothetical protein